MIDRRIADPQYASHLVFWNGSNILAQCGSRCRAPGLFRMVRWNSIPPWSSIIALILLVDRQEERGRHRLEAQAFHLLDTPPDAQVPDPDPAGQPFQDLIRRCKALDGRNVDDEAAAGTEPMIGRGDDVVRLAAG